MRPAVGKERLAITKKLLKIRADYPVFGSEGTFDVKKDFIVFGDDKEQLIVMRESDTQVGILVFNAADYEKDPWPEVKVAAESAKEGAVFVDVLETNKAESTFKVTNGFLYCGEGVWERKCGGGGSGEALQRVEPHIVVNAFLFLLSQPCVVFLTTRRKYTHISFELLKA